MAKRTLKTNLSSSTAAITYKADTPNDKLIADAKEHYHLTVGDDDGAIGDEYTSLAPEAIWLCFCNVHATQPKLEGVKQLDVVVDEMLKMEGEDNGPIESVAIANASGWVKAAAAVINANTEAMKEIEETFVAEEKRRQGPNHLFYTLLPQFAKTRVVQNPTRTEYYDCDIDDWAIPHSYNENETDNAIVRSKYYVGNGANKKTYENVTNSVIQLDTFKRENKKASSYMDLACALECGRHAAQERAEYRLGCIEGVAASGRYAAKGTKYCEDMMNFYDSRLKSIANQLRTVKKLWEQVKGLQNMPNVFFAFDTVTVPVDDNDPSKGVKQMWSNAAKPLKIGDMHNPTAYQPYSHSAFNTLNLEKAKDNGGTLDAIIKSVKKKGKKGGKGKATGSGTDNAPAQGSTVNWQINDFRSSMVGEQNFLNNPSNAISARQAFRAPPEHSDELLVAAARVFLFLHNTLGDAELCSRVDTLLKEKPGTFASILEGEVSTKNSGTIGKAA